MSGDEGNIALSDNAAESRYEIRVDGELAGFSQYRVRDAVFTMLHTEVRPEFGGRGIGSRLAAFALDDARSRGLEIAIKCPFIAAHVRGHEKYRDLVGAIIS